MDRMKTIQLQALRAVVSPDDEALYRFVCRWFSDKFNTPLLEVYDIPIEFVLQHYFEDMYEGMTVEERYEKVTELLENPAARQERLRREEEEIAEQVAVVTGHKKLSQEVKDRPPSALEKQVAGMFSQFKRQIKPATQQDPAAKQFVDDGTQDALELNSTPLKVKGGEEPINDTTSVERVLTPEDRIPPPPIDDNLEFSFSEDDFGDLPSLGPSKPQK